MRFSILAGALVVGLLIGARARADVRSLDEAELKDLAKFAAIQLKACPVWSKLREVAGPTITNKTAEHVDKTLLAKELVSRLPGEKPHWTSADEGVPTLELELASTQSEGGDGIVSSYELKISVRGTDCKKALKLEKRIGAH